MRIASLFILFLALCLALAQEDNPSERIITINYEGGTLESPDLRMGPYNYNHPETEGIRAQVSNLSIFASNAQLAAPEGSRIAESEGQREASFSGGVRVTRGRLEATGPTLIYSETTGEGVLSGGVSVIVSPRDDTGDPVMIEAEEITFDVDTDISISRGAVSLVNGNQQATAEEVIFEEERGLAKLSSSNQVNALREGAEGNTTAILSDELRALTNEKKLLATGNVSISDDDITSSGHTVFFDDETGRAEIIGDPARSVQQRGERTIRQEGPRIEHLTDIDVIRILDETAEEAFDPEEFALLSEQE